MISVIEKASFWDDASSVPAANGRAWSRRRADPRPVDGDPRPRRLVGVARYKRSEAELLQPLLAGNRRARHERRIIGGKEDDALGALIGRAHVADLSGACRR